MPVRSDPALVNDQPNNSNAQDAITAPASPTNNLADGLGLVQLLQKLQGQDAGKPKEVVQLNAFTLRDAKDLPPVRWYVDNLIAEKSITLLYAEAKSGKTYLAGHLALSMVSGKKEWIDGRKIDFPDDATVLLLEDDMGHAHTLRRMDQVAYGIEAGYADRCPEMFDRFMMFTPETVKAFHIGRFDLFKRTSIDELIQFIERYNVKLIILDTLTKFRGSSDENSAGDMNQVFTTLKEIRDKTDCSSLLLHHANKGNGFKQVSARGSTVIYAEPDMVLHLVKDKDDNCYSTLEVEYSRDTESYKIGLYQTWPQRIDDDGHAMYDANGKALDYYQLEYDDLKNRKSPGVIQSCEYLYDFVKDNPGCGTTFIRDHRAVHGVSNTNLVSKYLADMVDAGRLIDKGKPWKDGVIHSHSYYAVEPKAETGKEKNDQPKFC